MNILGISAYYHDSAACLVQDGRIIAAAQEERFTRKKHDFRFPQHAIDYCLTEGGLAAKAWCRCPGPPRGRSPAWENGGSPEALPAAPLCASSPP